MPQAGSPFGVTSFQVVPPSSVRWTSPLSVPTQISRASRGEISMVQIVPKPQGRAFSSVTSPAQSFAFGSVPVRSGLAFSQLFPWSGERSRYCEPV